MPVKSFQELYAEELRDLFSAETQLVEALPEVAKAISDPKLKKAVEKHLEQTKGHVQRLEKIFKSLGEDPFGHVCKAMEGLIEEGEGVIESIPEGPLRDAAIIGGAQKVEHYEIASYGTVRAFAEMLGLSDHRKLLEATLAEESQTDDVLTKLATTLINQKAAAVEGGKEDDEAVTPDEPIDLTGKRALVTGGTTGNGRAIAKALVAAGAKVMIYGTNKNHLKDALADMKGAVGLVIDQSIPEQIEMAFREVDSKLGGLDILVNNASINAESVVDGDYAAIDEAVRTNLIGYMACTSHAIKRMKEVGRGDIVNIGSMSAVERTEDGDIYTGIKAGVNGFTYGLRAKVKSDNIRVVLIEPGLVGTDMTAEDYPPETQRRLQRAGQMLKAEDVARCVLFALQQPARCDVIHMRVEPHHKQG